MRYHDWRYFIRAGGFSSDRPARDRNRPRDNPLRVVPQVSAASRRSAEVLLSGIDFPNKNRLRCKGSALRGGYRGCAGSAHVACLGRRSWDSRESLSAIGEISKLRGPASTCHKYILENQRHIYHLQFPGLAGEGALGIPLSNRREFRSGRCRRWLG